MAIDKRLLIHWWHYYGKVIYTFAELEKFEKVIDEYGADKVLDVAVASYVCGDGSPTIMLKSIRKGTVKKLFEFLRWKKRKKNSMRQYEINSYRSFRKPHKITRMGGSELFVAHYLP